jgi:hypothetical protein
MADAAALTSDNSPPRVLAWPMEAVLATVVVAAPWMYGAVHPGFEFVLDGGVALLLVLWAVRMLWERQLTIARCPVTVLLALLVLLGLFQITPLSPSILRTVSPTTALLYERLLPSSPETLPAAAPSKAEGLTISLAPDATRNRCFRLLAVLLVFAMVRNNLGNISALTRLAFVLVINGFALCLFGVIQHLTSPPDTLYWTYPSLGQVFGPFVSRNMFPYYVNMCIGLGIGLILGRLARQSREPIGGVQSSTRYQAKAPLTPLATKRIGGAQPGTQYQAKVPLTQLTAKQQQALQSLAGIWDQAKAALTRAVSFWLHDAPSLWLLAAVAFMGSAVAFSLSRGGFAALVGALLFVAVVSRGIAGRGILLAGAAVVAGLALFFLAWSGMSVVEKRLNTLWEPEKADQARVPMWLRVLPAVPEFPFWGTGFGTFQYVEVWKRGEQPIVPSENPTDLQPLEPLLFEHAHNDYVEKVVEAGLPGFALVSWCFAMDFRP